MGIKVLPLLGVALVMTWFLYNGYICVSQPKVYGAEVSRSYAAFNTWFETGGRKFLPKVIPTFKLPNPELISKYKDKIPLAIGYVYLLGSIGLLLDVKLLAVPIII